MTRTTRRSIIEAIIMVALLVVGYLFAGWSGIGIVFALTFTYGLISATRKVRGLGDTPRSTSSL